MQHELNYVVDSHGQKSMVLVPVAEWDNLNSRYKRLRNKVRILTGIQIGLREVTEARKVGKKLQTLNDFLNESNGTHF